MNFIESPPISIPEEMSNSDDGKPISKQIKTMDILSKNSPLRKSKMDDLNSKASDEPFYEGEDLAITNHKIITCGESLQTRLIIGQYS